MTNTNAAKTAHSCNDANNQDKTLFDKNVVKFKRAWDKDGKHLVLKDVPIKECYFKSGNQ